MLTPRKQLLFTKESLNDILLRDRPSLAKLWLELFDELPHTGSMISIKGKEGKSLLSRVIIARLLTSSGSGSDDTAEPEVLLCDTSRNFRILQLAGNVKERAADSSDENIEKILDKLTYQQFDNPYSHDLLISEIEEALKENVNISLVVVDSLGYFFSHVSLIDEHVLDEQRERISKVSFYYAMLDKMKILSKKYGVTFLNVKSNYSQLKYDERQTDIFLEIDDDLTNAKQKRLLIKNRFNNEIRSVKFIIRNSSSIDFTSEPEIISNFYRHAAVKDENNDSSQDDNVVGTENFY